MESRMQQVENKLSRVGQNCNTRNIERITRNATKSFSHNRDREVEKYTFASQLAVLRSCPVVMARLMKNGGSYLLIAKVLVISRLLHKSLSLKEDKPPIIDGLRDKLGTLRARLLRRIDQRLARKGETEDIEGLIESMCAYSLATSSTPTDVLRHFHHVRTDEVNKLLRHQEGLKEHGIQALRLCLQTAQDTQAIFPRRLAESLAKLKAHPLVQDLDVRALYELNLDIHERWVGDEARNYTPWPRHDELQRPEAEKLLHQWSKQAISAFLKGIKASLKGTRDLKVVADLRQELVETWIMSGSRMAGIKSRNVLDDLRDAMNGQLENIVRSRTGSLKSVVQLITAALGDWEGDGREQSLWDTTVISADLVDGARVFKQRVVDTHQGRDGAVSGVIMSYDKWIESVLEVKGIVKSMKETRWDDPFADDVDVDESDDEFGSGSKQTLLSDDDPRLLEEVTQDALSDALSSLGSSFEKIMGSITGDEQSRARVTKAVFVLRIVREISERIPRLRLNDKSTPLATPFTKDVMKPLYDTLAGQIVRPIMKAYQKSLAIWARSRSKSHILWEGNPPLPAQPSPSAFRFLQTLVKGMGSYGADLWAPEGVQVLRGLAAEEVGKIWIEALQVIATARTSISNTAGPMKETGETEEHEETSDSAKSQETVQQDNSPSAQELKEQKMKQLLYDIFYIQRYLLTVAHSDTNNPLIDKVSGVAGVDENMKTRLYKSAGDYTRKTYLLFALLV
jgi:conserved oligomeric Golgi complex subunit 1